MIELGHESGQARSGRWALRSNRATPGPELAGDSFIRGLGGGIL